MLNFCMRHATRHYRDRHIFSQILVHRVIAKRGTFASLLRHFGANSSSNREKTVLVNH